MRDSVSGADVLAQDGGQIGVAKLVLDALGVAGQHDVELGVDGSINVAVAIGVIVHLVIADGLAVRVGSGISNVIVAGTGLHGDIVGQSLALVALGQVELDIVGLKHGEDAVAIALVGGVGKVIEPILTGGEGL